MLLNLDDNNSFVSTILILTLPLPMFFYLLNFIVKYLKNESIEYKDYYLYNDYVVERVNMYRIAYTLIVNYFIRNYCIINISIIIKGFIAINEGNTKNAIDHFSKASSIEDKLVYNEPRDWLLNSRE